ncbi:MAG: hypothetical protein PVG41_04575, partial [Desulfobacteraceae bacterium]
FPRLGAAPPPLPQRLYTAFFIAALGKSLIIGMNRIHRKLLPIQPWWLVLRYEAGICLQESLFLDDLLLFSVTLLICRVGNTEPHRTVFVHKSLKSIGFAGALFDRCLE